ncbi:MAG: hypothetical protein WA364_15940 [Candidatus Nitrosopolaris sp.]
MNRYLFLIAGQVLITTIILFYILNNIIHRPVIVAGFDKFGIKEIYATKNGGEDWFMKMLDPNNDPRTVNTPEMTLNEDGSWKVAFDNTNNNKPQQLVIPIQYTGTSCQDEVRYSILTSSGYDVNKIIIDQQELETRGYMQSPNDWRMLR